MHLLVTRLFSTVNQEHPSRSIQSYDTAKLDIKKPILSDVLRNLQEVKTHASSTHAPEGEAGQRRPCSRRPITSKWLRNPRQESPR